MRKHLPTSLTIVSRLLTAKVGAPSFEAAFGRRLREMTAAEAAESYARLFSINGEGDAAKFLRAFRISTEGQGGEINKVRSLVSSSLLQLLVFIRLFGNADTGLSIEIPISLDAGGVETEVSFDRCLFEVRNRAVRAMSPSCVDVALWSGRSRTLLFLESKFTEYTRVRESLMCGKGYADLYMRAGMADVLRGIVDVSYWNGRPVLAGTDGRQHYLDGIQQSISHLTGLTRGPQMAGCGFYPADYHARYSSLYGLDDIAVCYGTILFDPRRMGVEGIVADRFEDYVRLYSDTVGAHGAEIIEAIRVWDHTSGNLDRGKTIRVLPRPLTYQTLFDNPLNRSMLTEGVRMFYGF